jgi:hypothetical protein
VVVVVVVVLLVLVVVVVELVSGLAWGAPVVAGAVCEETAAGGEVP